MGKMEAVRTPETSVYFHETTRRYIPESFPICTRRYENLKSHGLCDHSSGPFISDLKVILNILTRIQM
jgi:hypothetical protein